MTFEMKQTDHVAVCLSSVTSHLYAVADGDTWGRVKVQFGTGLPAGPDKYQFPASRPNFRRGFLLGPDQRKENMENSGASSGLASVCGGDNPTQQINLWRPWDKTEGQTAQFTTRFVHGEISSAQPKIQQVIHPVKLFWPKSKCFDYLYRDAETLLRNYPIQATICPCENSSSDEEGEDEYEEEIVGKEHN
ncbi:protein ripply2 [Poecilia reticulata]|nr:PREDICTED: protein ripply2-like [Poecilia reticulata]